MAAAAPLPADVRVMNAVASLLYALAAAALVAALLVALSRASLFTLRAVRIDGGLGRSSVATVRANALPRLAGNFFSLDLGAARAAFESVPWVRRAVVRRVWPNRLAVALEEHRAVALWTGEDGNDRLVNAQGEVFDANVGDVEDEGLPRFEGPPGSAPQMLALHDRLAPLFARLDLAPDTLVLSRRGSWRAELDPIGAGPLPSRSAPTRGAASEASAGAVIRAVVELGRGSDDEVVERTDRFVRTLSQVAARDEHPLEYADLRHRDGYAVRLKGIRTTLPGDGARKNQRQ